MYLLVNLTIDSRLHITQQNLVVPHIVLTFLFTFNSSFETYILLKIDLDTLIYILLKDYLDTFTYTLQKINLDTFSVISIFVFQF